MNPQFPIYIPSKGRWQTRITVKTLDRMNVPYKLVVEESEYAEYRSVIPSANLLVLDPQYQRDYDTCDKLGDEMPKGSGPARNFIWDDAITHGHPWHWIMDDNIRYFMRLNRNEKHWVADGTIFRCMEDFVLRYENVAMAGPHCETFVHKRSKRSPVTFNTRIYSCNLIRNDVPFRWRGRFNEDTDLSLRMLKAGWCTVLFNAFLNGKAATMRIRGGNTDTIYTKGTEAKSRMIRDLHPDVTELVTRWGRPHHKVNYAAFKKNLLIKKPGLEINRAPDEYGMELVSI